MITGARLHKRARSQTDHALTSAEANRSYSLQGNLEAPKAPVAASAIIARKFQRSARRPRRRQRWGETPAAFVVLRQGPTVDVAPLTERVNARLGKTQAAYPELTVVRGLPRSPIGKILQRKLRGLTGASAPCVD